MLQYWDNNATVSKEQVMHAVDQKVWKGKGMEGTVARWYARTRRNDMLDFRRDAKAVAECLSIGCHVLEVAPGPGFFAVELAKLGDFKITGLDISRTLVEIATENARKRGCEDRIPFGERIGDAVCRRIVRFHLLLGSL
jgi:2-polyprenyl-3-methyl-5-hydroxy-6-metoxy-1,4-benzoquinol methylase